MKFAVLKDYANIRLYGVGLFLDMWQVDALRALSECMMGDRDSEAGVYFMRLVEEGFINKDDLETACLEWLKIGDYRSPGSGDFMRALELVLGLAHYFKLDGPLTWVIDSFDMLYLFVSSYREEHFARTLVDAVLRSNDVRKIWRQLRGHFVAHDYCNSSLFYTLYVLNADLSAPGEMDSQLYRLAKMAKRIGFNEDFNSFYLKSLWYMLMHKFGYHFHRGQVEQEFNIAKARSEKWLKSQAIACKFPI